MFDYQRGYHIYMCGFCSCLHSTADSSLSTQQHQAPRALQIDHLVIPTLRITVSKMPRFFKNPALSTSSIIFSIFPAMDLWCWDFWHLLSWYHHGALCNRSKWSGCRNLSPWDPEIFTLYSWPTICLKQLWVGHQNEMIISDWTNKNGGLTVNQQNWDWTSKVAGFPELVPKSSCTESPFKTLRCQREGFTAAWQCGCQNHQNIMGCEGDGNGFWRWWWSREITSIMIISIEST